MGYASSIALGIALQKPSRNVYCFDGDGIYLIIFLKLSILLLGATIMHMGTMPIIGSSKCTNFKHVIFNNGSHDSVGA